MASEVGAAAEQTTPQDDRQGVRAFWTYWTASATSMVGSSVGAVALPLTALLVLDATAFEMGLIAASSTSSAVRGSATAPTEEPTMLVALAVQ